MTELHMREFITDLIVNTDMNIDEAKSFFISMHADTPVDQLNNVWEEAMRTIPELN